MMRLLAAALVPLALASSSPALLSRVPTPPAPCGVGSGYGAVWVATDGGGTISRIDPSRNRVTRSIRVGRSACTLSVGAGAVWAIRYNHDEVVRLDPKTWKIRRLHVGHVPADVLVAASSVWVTGWEDRTLTRIDSRTLRVTAVVRLPAPPQGLLLLGGSIWVGSGKDSNEVFRVDPATLAVTRVPVGVRAPGWFVAGAKDVWVVTSEDSVVHIDPVTNQVVTTVPVPGVPVEGASAPDGLLWIPSKQSNTVTRIDPKTNRVVGTLPAGPGAYVAHRAFGSMWVTSYAGADVRRYRP
jgi:DNA-binding beta-propeller fold protein YncE